MHILLLALVALGLLAALLGMLSRKTENNEPEVVQADAASCATCNGEDERCEQECMLEAAVKTIEYYDDDVLYTMKPEEVKGWNRSLILRQINLPNQLKDEVIMMMKG